MTTPIDTQISRQRATRSREWWRRRWLPIRGTWNAAWAAEISRDPLLRDVYMVVELVFGGGKRYRVATAALAFDFTGPAGGTERIAVLPLLKEEPEISTEYTFGSGSSAARTFAVSIANLDLDAWGQVLGGQRMLAGWAEVSLIAAGMDWADRFVLMRGDMTGGTSFGAVREEISISISDPKLGCDLGITEFVFEDARFALTAENGLISATSTGQRYPLALNSPRKVPGIRVDSTTSPEWIACYGHSATVDLVYVDGLPMPLGNVIFPWVPAYQFDDFGTPYLAIDFLGGGFGAWSDSTSVHVSLSDPETRDVIDVIEYLASEWSLLGPTGISQEAFGRARARALVGTLPAIAINGSGSSDATKALEYIEQTICGSFPMISMAWQPSGYGPILTDRRASPVATWIVGSGDLFRRETDWTETDKQSLVNWLTYRYNYDPLLDVFGGVQLRNPTTHLLCAISEEQAGPLEGDPIESTIVLDDATAVWVADWQVAHLAIPSYLVEYVGPASILFKFRLGDNVDVVDTEITGCSTDNPIRSTIEAIRYVRGKVTVTLRMWPLFADVTAAAYGATAPLID